MLELRKNHFMNKRFSTIYFLSAIALIVLAGAGVVWYANNVQKDIETVENLPVVTTNPSENGEEMGEEIEELPVSDIDTSNWKTYRNEEYGFEVKYPEGYLKQEPEESEDSYNKKFHLWFADDRNQEKYVWLRQVQFDFDSDVNSYFGNDAGQIVSVKDEVYHVVSFSKGFGDGPGGIFEPILYFRTLHNNHVYTLEFVGTTDIENAFITTVLQSFRLI